MKPVSALSYQYCDSNYISAAAAIQSGCNFKYLLTTFRRVLVMSKLMSVLYYNIIVCVA